MATTKLSALTRAKILKRALEGTDLKFFLGLNPNVTVQDNDGAYVFVSDGLTMTLHFDSKGSNCVVDNVCRYESLQGERELSIPDNSSIFAPSDRQYGMKGYMYSVHSVDTILGEGHYFLRHLKRCDLLRLGRALKFTMRQQDKMLKKGFLQPSEYGRLRKYTEIGMLHHLVPLKVSLTSINKLIELF